MRRVKIELGLRELLIVMSLLGETSGVEENSKVVSKMYNALYQELISYFDNAISQRQRLDFSEAIINFEGIPRIRDNSINLDDSNFTLEEFVSYMNSKGFHLHSDK